MEPKRRTISIGYFILAFLLLWGLQSVLFGPHTATLSYSEFTAQAGGSAPGAGPPR